MKRRIRFLSLSVVIFMLTAVSLALKCERNSVFDINSPDYIPNKKPHAFFADSLISGYLLDTVSISISWADTAKGGVNGGIKKIYFDWKGDGHFSESVSGIQSSPFKLKKAFSVRNNLIRMKAVDLEDDTSAVDSAWLTIKQSTPAITSVIKPEKISKGIPFTITLTSTDTGGVITSYLWAIDEKNYSRTTDAASLTLSFDNVGNKTILVKARDNKKIESAPKTISLSVIDPKDTVGPKITFLSPLNRDTVHTRNLVILLQAADPSGVSEVTLNDTVTMQLADLAWRGTISLAKGENILVAKGTDSKGYKTSTSIRIFYSPANVDKNSPAVVLIAPPRWKDTVNTKLAIVKLLALDESGVAGVFLDGEKMDLDPVDSSYSTTKNLQQGLNRFVVKSVDRLGNAGVDSLSIVWTKDAVDSTKPVITIAEPRSLQHIQNSVVSIRGTVIDASTISSVMVNGTAAVLHYPNWNAVCNLNHGENIITVTATDSSVSRNNSEKSIRVIQNQIPQFTLTPDSFVIAAVNSSTTFSATTLDDDSTLVFSLARSPVVNGAVSSLKSTISSTSFTYIATKSGIDTFSLIVVDPWGDADTARWRVLVPSDSTPVFITDVKSLPALITAFDTCRVNVSAQDPNKKTLRYSLENPAPAGMKIDSSNGRITWIPLDADTGANKIVIQASNGMQKSLLTWNVIVLSRDLPPKLASVKDTAIYENQLLQLTLNATDLNNDSLEYSFGSIFPDGSKLDRNRFSWTPDFSSSGVHKVVFIVREKNRKPSLADSQTVNITVKNVNQKPVLINPGVINGAANQSINFDVSATDPDNDSISVIMTNSPVGAVLSGKKFTWTPTNAQTGTVGVKFTARDNGTPQLSDTLTIFFRINYGNGAPVLTSPGNKTVNENQLVQFNLTAADPNNDSLIFSMKNGPSGAQLNGKSFSWQPSFTQADTYTVKFYVHDNVSPPAYDSVTITITVKNINAPPVLTSPGSRTINETAQLSFTLSATDVDNNTLKYSMSNPPPGATLTGSNFSWKPTYTQAGTYQMTFYVEDNGTPALKDSQAITIKVNNLNHPPVFRDSTITIKENDELSFQLNANSPDGARLDYKALILPPNPSSLTNTGWLWYRPTFDQAGTYIVKIIARDTSNATAILSDTSTITLIVKNLNRPPVFTDSTAQTVAETQTLTFQLKATDPDGNPIRYLPMTTLPAGAVLSLSGAFSWKPLLTDANTYNIRFVAVDSSVSAAVLKDTVTVKVTVTNTNPSLSAPVLPIDKALAQPRSITFKWKKSLNAANYFLQVAHDSAFTNFFFQDSLVTDTFKTVSGLLNGTSYYWRVNALNPGGRSGWTVKRMVTTINSFSLTITTVDSGSVQTIPQNGPFDSASIVSLKAIPKSGYHFENWSGNASGVQDTTSVVMNAAKTITANFAINSYDLTVSAGLGGTITVPDGTFPKSVNHGVATTITASADPGYSFVDWTVVNGEADIENVNQDSTTVILSTGAAIIQANFTLNP